MQKSLLTFSPAPLSYIFPIGKMYDSGAGACFVTRWGVTHLLIDTSIGERCTYFMTNGVEFDIDTEPRVVVQTKTPAMVKLVIKLSGGLINDERQANYVLLGLVILVFIISYFIAFGGGGGSITPASDKIPLL